MIYKDIELPYLIKQDMPNANTNDGHNKKHNDTKFCMRLHEELSQCKNIFIKPNDDVVCDYFNLVFQMKCLGININTLDKKK
jgi:hypothetical protein